MSKKTKYIQALMLGLLLHGTILHAQITSKSLEPAVEAIRARLSNRAYVNADIDIDTFYVRDNCIDVHFSAAISDYPLRDLDISFIKKSIIYFLPDVYSQYHISLYCKQKPLDRLSSAYFSGRGPSESVYMKPAAGQWIKQSNAPCLIQEGLSGRNIAIWAGHGYYYSHSENRWKWQRAPFFSTIEDLLAHSYVTGFLAPMLENAGACVLMPRERDFQTREIIIDNGDAHYSEKRNWKDSPKAGFAYRALLPEGTNPFKSGTARIAACNGKHLPSASYRPFFPESGEYSVWVSYQSLPESSTAEYTITYSGGTARFSVDQRMGGGTWVYLGTFRFTEGETEQGVTVSAAKGSDGIITTDAVRFGGGMGNVVREGETSGVPRYAEAARYWLQWSGFPETVYSPDEGRDDYKDDYMSRGEWVNSLREDFNIPIDLALALHTDAGTVMTDSTIGTLAIYREDSKGCITYPDGRPRLTSRELADIVQTTIVDDIRACYRQEWTRRAIWDRSYMEARVPEVPTVLIELLSHQNLADIQCALDPEFKFLVSRAIYKGILKYISYCTGRPYSVQPLPVKDCDIRITERNGNRASVKLTWSPRTDRIEPSAEAESYIVYRRVMDPYGKSDFPGFDGGTPVSSTEFTDLIEPGKLYSYKIIAVNKGGLSFPSEILSAGYMPGKEEILIINGFTGVSAPAVIGTHSGDIAGFDFRRGHGIPYIKDISYIGEQYEFDRTLGWLHDDRPGFGASYMEYGPEPVAGNTFDYAATHGLAIMRSGYGFCSSSIGALLSGKTSYGEYKTMDLILGNEDSCFTDSRLTDILSEYCSSGGSLLVSGSNIGKSSDYNPTAAYPETAALISAAGKINSAAGMILSIKDSLPDCTFDPHKKELITALTASIDETASNLKEISSITASSLSESMNGLLKDTDKTFTAYSFTRQTLRYRWSNADASSSGTVRIVSNPYGVFKDFTSDRLTFNTDPDPRRYCVDSPDAIIPSDRNAHTVLRYKTVNTSAAVAYDSGDYRCISIGFPIEALTSQQQIDDLMREVIRFLMRD